LHNTSGPQKKFKIKTKTVWAKMKRLVDAQVISLKEFFLIGDEFLTRLYFFLIENEFLEPYSERKRLLVQLV
jgi:hypothetical protein